MAGIRRWAIGDRTNTKRKSESYTGKHKETFMAKSADAQVPQPSMPSSRFWPEGWWRLMEYRIGIIPLPVYILIAILIVGLVVTGAMGPEISMAIVVFAFFGFTCAEIGKRLPLLRNIGAAAIFATFIPS